MPPAARSATRWAGGDWRISPLDQPGRCRVLPFAASPLRGANAHRSARRSTNPISCGLRLLRPMPMPLERPPFDTIALVLQGGGALGAYQAGVMEGLADAGIEPDWVAGISIGAINAALIAGNAPAQRIDRLREFWK